MKSDHGPIAARYSHSTAISNVALGQQAIEPAYESPAVDQALAAPFGILIVFRTRASTDADGIRNNMTRSFRYISQILPDVDFDRQQVRPRRRAASKTGWANSADPRNTLLEEKPWHRRRVWATLARSTMSHLKRYG